MKKKLITSQNEYKGSGIWPGVFLAPKINYCLTINKFVNIDENKTFVGLTSVSDNLDGKECFKRTDGGKLIARVPLSWKNHIVKQL